MVKKTEPTQEAAPGATTTDQAEQGGDHVESLGQIAQLGQQLEAPPAAAPGAVAAQKAEREAAAAEIAAALSLLRAAQNP